MGSASKSPGNVLYALQNVAANAYIIGSDISLPSQIAMRWNVDFGRDSSTAFTNSPVIKIQKKVATGQYVDISQYTPGLGNNITSQAVVLAASGQPTATMVATGNFAIQDIVFFKNGTLANSEWKTVLSTILNTSITMTENFINSQSGSTAIRQGEMWDSGEFSLAEVSTIRYIIDNSNNANAFNTRAYYDLFSSFG